MDEFSDFQMAVGPHSSSSSSSSSSHGGNGLKTQNGLWVLEHSSRHAMSSSSSFPAQTINNSSSARNISGFEGFGNHHQFNTSFTNTQPTPPPPAATAAAAYKQNNYNNNNNNHVRFAPLQPVGSSTAPFVDKYSVGSRLANYDLGMKTPMQPEDSLGMFLGSGSGKSTFIQHSSSTGHLSNGGAAAAVNNGKNHCGANNSGPSLLIGEEDKYAALRVLVNDDSSKDHQELNETQTFSQHSFGGGKAQEVNGIETDFGDFQSFSGTRQQPDFFGSNLVGNFTGFDLQTNPVSNHFQTLPAPPVGLTNSNSKDVISSCDDFGDFVSVEPPSVQNSNSLTSNLKENKPVTDCFDDLLGSQWNSEVDKKSTSSSDVDWISALNSDTDNKSQGISKISDVEYSHNFIANSTSPEYLSNINIQENILQEQASKTPLPLPLVSTKIELLDASESSTRCASFHEINHDSLELGFYGQKDVFNSCLNTRNPSIDISPESRSIASLDLGNYCTSNESCDIGRNPEQVFPYESEEMVGKDTILTMGLPFEPSKSVQQYDFYKANNNTSHSSSSPTASKDKYQCFKEELDTDKEKCLSAWIRCLKSCRSLLEQAIELFNIAPSSSVIREIVTDDKGYGYVKRESNRVGDIGNEIQNGWDTLISLFLGTSVMGILTTSADDLRISTSCEQQKLCGVCKNPEDGWDDFVECEGNTYHSSCANLWINVLDTNLPLLPQIPF